jgi:hypothetical protein
MKTARNSPFWNNRTLFRAGILMLVLGIASVSEASTFHLVSTVDPSLGPPVGGDGDSYLPVMSRDGRYVLFASTADNLVALQTNRPLPKIIPTPLNVFLRDRVQGSTVLVSVNLDGTGGGNGDSWPIGVSTNGRYALFESSASNLIAGDTNNADDVFLRDLITGSTVLVSASTNGAVSDGTSYSSTMTPDGRYVAFSSTADNLVDSDTNGIPDIFVRDMTSKLTTLITVGAQTNSLLTAASDLPLLTPDGRYVAFYSTALNLVPGLATITNIYLRDRTLGVTTCASAGALGALQSLPPVTNALAFNAALSDDGRYVAFEAIRSSQASPAVILRFDAQTGQTDLIDTNAAVPLGTVPSAVQDLAITPDGRFVSYVVNVPDDPDPTTAIRLWDAQSGLSVLVSGNPTNSVTDGSISDSPVLSEAGRVVAFVSNAPDLVTNDLSGEYHLYLRDLQAGTTTLIDVDTNGVGSLLDPIIAPVLSADGALVAFDSQDGSIVAADRNRSYDVFIRDITNSTAQLISSHDPALPSFTPDGPSSFSSASQSFDSRLVAFWSEADDLVLNVNNGVRNIYLHDSLAGTNLLISVNTNGLAADGVSTDPAISADGQFVAFTSLADDLVAGDANQAQDVFVMSLQQRVPTLVSVNQAGTGPGNSDSYSPMLSSNGQFILFLSKAGDLAPGLISGTENLFLRDLQSQTTYALTSNGVAAAQMTPSGAFVAYATSSSRSSGTDRLYIWSTQSHSTVYNLNGSGFVSLAISPDGQRLAYATNSTAKQLWVGDWAANTNWAVVSTGFVASGPLRFSSDGHFLVYGGHSAPAGLPYQIYTYDFQAGTNILVSQAYDGSGPGNDNSDSADISSDGRFVAYRSAADNLVPNDTNGVPDIFLYDRLGGITTLVTASRLGNGSADNRSLTPLFSGDGRTLVLVSWASDLMANDFNNNADIFSMSLFSTNSIPAFSVQAAPVSGPTGPWLSWPVMPGKTYHVQFKNSLTDPDWQDLGEAFSVLGDRAYLKEEAPLVSQRFYRVIAY